MAYLLDSNIFIEAHCHYYGFSICPGFWAWLDEAHEKGSILSILNVWTELLGREDWLAGWVKRRKHMFVDTKDAKTYSSLPLLAGWVKDHYADAAEREKFFIGADFVLVGYAHAHNHTIVTAETPSNGKQVKIPNACKGMDVGCINTFQMLAAAKAKFYLPSGLEQLTRQQSRKT